jgi:ribose transport system permease protein
MASRGRQGEQSDARLTPRVHHRGGVVGTVFGAVLIQTVENGLVMTNADPYVYPLIISAIIFIAVLVDSIRTGILDRLEMRKIRVEET